MLPNDALARTASAEPVAVVANSAPADIYPAIKRGFDIIVGVCVGLAILPLMLLLVAIVRGDGGPALYAQPRLGRDGRVFTLWKIRTMVCNADQALADYLATHSEARQEWDRTQKLRLDPRVTPIGRILRKYSLDELPQVWNVLAGDMSLVGPRPMFPEQRVLYPGTPYCNLRPGITGLWQVSERNACAFADRAKFDRMYSEAFSLRTDLVIMLRTVSVVLRGTGC
jgi:lipopolysaccharide/colanic/teichoic acid biosynthesis glycosyltransferase